jgi:hypothetical protein
MPKVRFNQQAQSHTKAPTETKTTKSTKRQCDRIDILCNDAGVGARLSRNDFIGQRVGRKISYLDELTLAEASMIIEKLNEMIYGDSKDSDGEQQDSDIPEAERQLCGQCLGAGTVCSVCSKSQKDCMAEGRAGSTLHTYDPVVCDICDGKRFELA